MQYWSNWCIAGITSSYSNVWILKIVGWADQEITRKRFPIKVFLKKFGSSNSSMLFPSTCWEYVFGERNIVSISKSSSNAKSSMTAAEVWNFSRSEWNLCEMSWWPVRDFSEKMKCQGHMHIMIFVELIMKINWPPCHWHMTPVCDISFSRENREWDDERTITSV